MNTFLTVYSWTVAGLMILAVLIAIGSAINVLASGKPAPERRGADRSATGEFVTTLLGLPLWYLIWRGFAQHDLPMAAFWAGLVLAALFNILKLSYRFPRRQDVFGYLVQPVFMLALAYAGLP